MSSKELIKEILLEYVSTNDLSEFALDKLINYIEKLLISSSNIESHIQNVYNSRIAFCGFGSDDVFPSFLMINLFGFIDQDILYDENSKTIISHKTPRSIELLAQSDTMDAIINGINEPTEKRFNEKYIETFDETINNLEEHPLEKFQKDNLSAKIKNYDWNNLHFEITKNSWGPIYNAVQSLPLFEMAKFAKDLVSITSTISKFSVNDETNSTVGGDIDVAIIDRGNGFRWFND